MNQGSGAGDQGSGGTAGRGQEHGRGAPLTSGLWPPTPRLGVIGTPVWDRLWRWEGDRLAAEPVEGWGGITYSLAALAAEVLPPWRVVPLLKLGADRADEAMHFLSTLPLELGAGVRVVDEPMNFVELRYQDAARRVERLSGGVSPWSWDELEPLLAGLDALYINFVSGYEMELPTLERLRAAFPGPIYADLHSLLLGREVDGTRVPQPLAEWRRWVSCLDVVQLNEDEILALTGQELSMAATVGEILAAGPGVVLVTRGAEGASFAALPAGARTQLFDVPLPGGPEFGDPTGCGDVWGATCCARMLADASIEVAIEEAHRAARRKLSHAGGAEGLSAWLRG